MSASENQATSSKRTRVDSTAPSATLPKRPRADDVEHLSHISEFHSAILLQQMERGWRMNEANQRLLLELKPSLAPADLHSHICSLGRLQGVVTSDPLELMVFDLFL